MSQPRDLAIPCDQFDWEPLLAEWRWIVPLDHVPLLLGAFGDWIIGAPDGSHWHLCLLEGDYRQIAAHSAEFNRLKTDPDNLNQWFKADWVQLAAEHQLIPRGNESLGWRVHPLLGGEFSLSNLSVFSMAVYQSLMGQLHQHISQHGLPTSLRFEQS